MKTIAKILTVALLSTGAFAASAQTEQAEMAKENVTLQVPTDLAKKQTDWMQKNLNLSAEQLEVVTKVNEKFATKVTEIINEGEETTDRIEDLNEEIVEKDTEIKNVLNEDQFSKYTEQNKKWNEMLRAQIG